MDTAAQAVGRARRDRRSRLLRLLGTALVVGGVGLLAWSFVVWRWNDPFTSLYTQWQQKRLDDELTALVEREQVVRPRPLQSPDDARGFVARRAKELRRETHAGRAIGRITVPRLDLDMVLVNGTDSATLKKGPGRDERTFMPGEGKLVYVAGHRTTYGAPFARIDTLRRGDRVTVEMPYATFRYVVTSHSVVDAHDLSVLRSRGREVLALQACHPRFFASQRYIVWGRLAATTPRS